MYEYLLIGFLIAGPGLLAFYFYQKNRRKEKSILFYGGLGYILVALPIVFSWFAFFSIIFIFIGIIFIVLSRYSVPKFLQIILLLLPVVVLSSLGFYEEASYNIFIIPKGYAGRVVIVHDCEDGADKEFEGRSRVYRVSANGLLKTKFSFVGTAFDSLHSNYFYIDSDGKKEPISQDLNEKDKVIVYGLWTLPYEHKGGINIDFIVDKQVSDANLYKPEDNIKWQKEIDSCRK